MSVESNTNRYRFQWVLLHPKHWLLWFALGLAFLYTLLPRALTDKLNGRLGRVFAARRDKRMQVVQTNLRLCYPNKSSDEIDAMCLAHFENLIRSTFHYHILWWRSEAVVRKTIVRQGFEQIDEYRRQGKNIIILLIHNVGLEFAVAPFSMDYHATGSFRATNNPVIDWLTARGRLRFGKEMGKKLYTREDGLRPLIKATRSGKIMIYLADEDLGADNAVFAPFFGVPKASVSVLGRLAKTCNAVVLPCNSCYDTKSQQYTVRLLPPITGLSGKDDAADSELMNKAVEQAVGDCPTQYMWLLKHFRTRPPGEPRLYSTATQDTI